MNSVIGLSIAIVTLASHVHARTSPSSRIEVQGVGSVMVVHEQPGEPIAAPEKLTVSIRCLKSGKTKRLGMWRMCRLEKSEYDKELRKFVLKLVSGRVIFNSGEVVCDQVDDREIDLEAACAL